LANVTPIFKKGKKYSVANYRPVSLTVNLLKGMQHGFVRNKSCFTNLLVFMEEVTHYIDCGYPVDIIYFDFQKAFDKVPHRRLLTKLDAHGIVGNILMWIENWLSNKKQQVILN